jgi:hypothetical protein
MDCEGPPCLLLRSTAQAHVQKRFEEGGANRHHLIGTTLRFQVHRQHAGGSVDAVVRKAVAVSTATVGAPPPPVPERKAIASVTTSGPGAPMSDARKPAPSAPVTLAPPPLPKSKRPMTASTLTPSIAAAAEQQTPVEFASAPVIGGSGDAVPYTPGPQESVEVSYCRRLKAAVQIRSGRMLVTPHQALLFAGY